MTSSPALPLARPLTLPLLAAALLASVVASLAFPAIADVLLFAWFGFVSGGLIVVALSRLADETVPPTPEANDATAGDRTPVSITLLHPDAAVPTNAKYGDAGFDLRSVTDVVVAPGTTAVIPTGIAIEIPSDTVAFVCSRSGLAAKRGVAVLNAPGVVDSGYRGEILAILHNHSTEPFHVIAGDRIAQLVLQRYLTPHFTLVDELNVSERGADGKGSTGVA